MENKEYIISPTNSTDNIFLIFIILYFYFTRLQLSSIGMDMVLFNQSLV